MFALQLRYLCFFFGIISILSFFNIIYSYYLNLYLNLDTYYLSFIFSALISIIFYKIKVSEKTDEIKNEVVVEKPKEEVKFPEK